MFKRLESLIQAFPLWRYYFWDLPLWAIGRRSQRRWLRIQTALAHDKRAFTNSLLSFYANRNNTVDIERAVEQALMFRVIRNSEAYTCLSMTKNNIHKHFSINGLEHLYQAQKQNRPIILLTAHMGSFYIMPIALAPFGFCLNTVARTVDDSQFNPISQRLFEHINYRLTETMMPGRYVYTNYANKMDRYIVTACKENGILLVLPDIPRKFLPSNRCNIQLFGKKSSLPGRIIDLGLKYNALFLTIWGTFELDMDFAFKRHIHIDPPLSGTDKKTVLQHYANRLSDIVYQEPWQWMGTAIMNQYDEENS